MKKTIQLTTTSRSIKYLRANLEKKVKVHPHNENCNVKEIWKTKKWMILCAGEQE